MTPKHRITIIAKQRPFNEAQWQQLLTAFAYVLHERRTASDSARPEPKSTDGGAKP